ncbi:MAG: DNA replication and repair protein RecF [Bacteroidota bacterium]
MHLKSIKVTNFKNYEQSSALFSTKLNCFVGLNGMGKTNLLDAIYYLCVGKSYFAASDRNVIRKSPPAGFFRVEGQFERKDREEYIVAKVIPGKRKEIERNKVAYQRLSEHLGNFPVVMIAPFDINIALEGSEGRRRFLNNTLSQLDRDYLKALIQYNKLLHQRNSALKQFAEQRRFDKALLEVYDRQMIPLAQQIFEKRQTFLADFAHPFQTFHHAIAAQEEQVQYQYRSQLQKQAFEDLLAAALEKDRILQRSTVGIHKDDIEFLINDLPLKRFASQGQLKSFVLALKLAQYQALQKDKTLPPILLLDDIFDRLDGNRVTQLIRLLLEQNFGQIFITDTDEHRMEQLIAAFNTDYKKFKIVNGEIA